MRGRKPQSDAIRRGLTDQLMVREAQGVAHGLGIPEDIAADPLRRVIWEWIVPEVNSFSEQDMPQLRELVMWHAVFESAQAVILDESNPGNIFIFDGDGKKHPALSVMKEASAEIRQLSDHLGLSPLARSRIGLFQTTAVKTAAETAQMFMDMESAYPELEAAYAEAEVVE